MNCRKTLIRVLYFYFSAPHSSARLGLISVFRRLNGNGARMNGNGAEATVPDT